MKGLFVGLAALALAAGNAQSLKDLRARAAEDRTIRAEAAYTSRICQRKISASIDWPSADGWPAGKSLAQACDSALGAVETACRAGRNNLVSRFVCAGDSSGPSLSGRVLRYGARPDADGFAETRALLGGG